jgi:DHA2 family multidrug resistance protein
LLYQLSSLQFLPFLCGNATNIWELVAFRFVQGLGGGALVLQHNNYYRELSIAKRGMAQAIYGMGVIVGPTLGPPLGGYLVDNFRGLIFSTLISH